MQILLKKIGEKLYTLYELPFSVTAEDIPLDVYWGICPDSLTYDLVYGLPSWPGDDFFVQPFISRYYCLCTDHNIVYGNGKGEIVMTNYVDKLYKIEHYKSKPLAVDYFTGRPSHFIDQDGNPLCNENGEAIPIPTELTKKRFDY